MIRLGFACKIVGVQGFPQMRSCLLRNATPENLTEITSHNLFCLARMSEYCAQNDIHLMRISSDVVPFASHAVAQNFPWREIFCDQLKVIGEEIKQCDIRVSMHPSQYTVLNSVHENVVLQAIKEIKWHMNFLDSLGTDESAKIVLHIGGIYGDKNAAMERFLHNFSKLDV